MVDSLVSTAAAGAAAGLGVAMPLGAVGVLLLQEGGRGLRQGAAAATAVALVDFVYAAVAVLVGPRLVGLIGGGGEAWVRAVAAAVLAAIAVRGLLSLRGGVPGAPAAAAEPGPARRSFVRFALLTLVNPTTALYFTALTAARGAAAAGAAVAVVFAVAVFAASLVWQQLLAAAGALAGTRLTVRTRRVTYALGYGLVLCFAVRLAWPAG
ncbi:lysine transporter LysE [Kitasatospora sp. DSM 101779]|uniref:lysine transporter LysE n=1 Tax=Kitasatospora sp. DSM 101779 TaxID=2853165 RepID=UPI0021D96AE6|nr:lysine transporter LysE [Kitasatospora sp. DSM 101779]MCU7826148.1 lysine transporter LysE [Kitasatospora sp. DSM 101779]